MQSNFKRDLGLQKFDASEFLGSPEDCAAYLQEFVSDAEDEALLFSAIGDVLKAQRRMSQASRELGVSREGLYKSLSEKGNPSFHTVALALKLLGLRFAVQPLDKEHAAA